MQACKSAYDYSQLCYNYIQANLDNLLPVKYTYTSTANGRLSFNDDTLTSYNTVVARIIKGIATDYLLISTTKYSVTTSRQLGILEEVANRFPIKVVYTKCVWNTLQDVLDEYMSMVQEFYSTKLLRIRKPENYLNMLLKQKQVIKQLYIEVPKKKRNECISQLNKYPDMPTRLDKFTRAVLRNHMEIQGIL